ncbi:hypothetical protein [Burkholderia metallica]|uniref:hypothetical protein n=1 Tax=Burkholderia metallica TaxID=488729 RepID=UPI001CF43198|nr:hypothetical protein [Burkholderia metallica]MCA7999428.1 hypothetical protein [Burkholderia metallica]
MRNFSGSAFGHAVTFACRPLAAHAPRQIDPLSGVRSADIRAAARNRHRVCVRLIVSGGAYYRLSRKLDLEAEKTLVRAHEAD